MWLNDAEVPGARRRRRGEGAITTIDSLDERLIACPVQAAHELLSGRWTLAIAFALINGPCTFGRLRRRVAPISANVLTQRLRSMTRTGIIGRERNDAVVVYVLTQWGSGLASVREAMIEWHRAGTIRQTPAACANCQ